MVSNFNQQTLDNCCWKSDRLPRHKEINQMSNGPGVLVLLAFCLSCMLAMCEAKPSPYPDNNKSLVRICGRELINVIKGLCKNCFRGTTVQMISKKTDQSEWIEDNDNLWSPLRIRRNTGGIATECCERQCTYSYMKSFCLPEDECKKSG